MEDGIGRPEGHRVHPQQDVLPFPGERGATDHAGKRGDPESAPHHDPPPTPVEVARRQRPPDGAQTHEDCHDREPDQEQDDVRDQRGPEHVGVADALVIEVVGAQSQEPAGDDQDDDDRHDHADCDHPPPQLAGRPDDTRPRATAGEDLLGIEAEGAHGLTECTSGATARRPGSAALEEQPNVKWIAPAAHPA